MSNIVQLYDASNNKVYPVTHLRSVRDSSGTTLESMMQDVREIAVGYYECSTPGNTAAKVITIDSSVFLSTKILCKVKFVEKNTVNNATMNINGTGAKALYYNGVRVAANNSWYPNEVVDLYYDGTNYQAKSCADTLEYDVSLHQTHEITEITTTTRTLVFNGNVVSSWESETPVSDSSVEGYTRSETNTGQDVDSTTVDGPNATYDSTANKTNVVYVTTHTHTHVVNNYTFSEAVNAVPMSYRHGGLKLRFISNSDDNKYVQYRLMSDTFNTTKANWQGIDNEPTVGSNNLVKSGGIAPEIINLNTLLKPTTIAIKGDSSIENRINTTDCTKITLLLKNTSDNSGYFRFALYDASDNLINGSDILINAGESYSRNVKDTSEVAYIIITNINSRTGELTITKNTNAIDNIKDLNKRTTDNENATILNKNILVDRVIPTDIYGYISTNGTVAVQTSGDNHRTDYFPVEQGSTIEYSGYYQYEGFSAVYGYDENKQPIAQLLPTGVQYTDYAITIDNASIKYVMAWGDITNGDLSVKVPAQHNISDIDSASQLFRDDFIGENISTNLFGYINSNGSVAIQTSGNNHRTDYISVEQGDKILYTGYYNARMSAVYGYDENKQPIAELLATGDWTNKIVEVNDSTIKYVMAWGDVGSHSLSVKILPKYNAEKLNTIEIVDANGNGDYLTLEEAIWNNISDKGDVAKHRTIIVMPGVYTMNTYYGNDGYFWKVIENRNLSIIGTDRNACILKNTKGKYVAGRNRIDDACLKLSGNVLIKNLTLLASHEDFDGAEGTRPAAYCIHLDSGGADCNLEIDNCVMVNKQSACIGIGTADNYTIQIRNCSLVTNVDNPSSFTSWSGAIICHNADYNNAATLRLENNVMRSNTPNTFTIARNGSYTSPIKLEAYRNIIWGNVGLDSGIVVLDELNFGNNKSELNYQS